jgi:hypothetical protein
MGDGMPPSQDTEVDAFAPSSPSRTLSPTGNEPLYSPGRTESGRSLARSTSPILPQLQPASEEHTTKTAKLLGLSAVLVTVLFL